MKHSAKRKTSRNYGPSFVDLVVQDLGYFD